MTSRAPSSRTTTTRILHNVAFTDGRLHIAHYHAGVWIVDVSTLERAQTPVTLAFYQPHEAAASVPRTPTLTDVPSVWSVRVEGGLVWAIDATTGLYALRYDGPQAHLPARRTRP